MSAHAISLDPKKHPYGLRRDGQPRKVPFRRGEWGGISGLEEYLVKVPGHPLPYDFRDLVEVCGPVFLQRLAKTWSVEFASDQPITTDKRVPTIKMFLRDLARIASEHPVSVQARVYKAISGDASLLIDPGAFEDATAAFCARLHKRDDRSLVKSDNKRTRNNIINGLSSTLNRLSKHGLFPADHGLTAIHTGPLEPRTLTVAEISASGPIDCSDPRKAFSLLLRDPALAQALNVPADGVHAMSVAELADSWLKVIALRIDALRACAVADLEEEYKVFEEGKAIRARADLPSRDQILCALEDWNPRYGLEDLLKPLEGGKWAVLPGKPEQRLLGLVVRAMAPDYEGKFQVKYLNWKLAHAISKSGGLMEITRRFEATAAAYTAANVIVLVDTIFNVSVCERLGVDLLRNKEGRRRHIWLATVEALKRRADNTFVTAKIVDDEVCQLDVKRVDRKKSAVWAIETWIAMSKPIRERAKAEGQGLEHYLWILPEGGKRHRGNVYRPHFVSSWNWWNDFKEKHRDDPFIGGLPLDRDMIRVSCLQMRSGPTAASTLMMQVLAQHASSRTTMPYGRTTVMEAVLAEQIRIFQDLLEVAVGSEIDDIAGILGLSPDEVVTRRNLALQTGLGFFCADPLAGERPGTKRGEICDKLEDCPICRLRKFVPNPEALEALWLWGKALREQRERWLTTNPERWQTIWLPWLAIVTVVEEKLNDGRFKVRYERAAASAAARLAAGKVAVPVLW